MQSRARARLVRHFKSAAMGMTNFRFFEVRSQTSAETSEFDGRSGFGLNIQSTAIRFRGQVTARKTLASPMGAAVSIESLPGVPNNIPPPSGY